MESIIDEFISLDDKRRNLSLLEYSLKHINVENSGRFIPFSLEGHEPLRKLYEEYQHPHISVRKAAQVGISTYASTKSLYLGERFGLSSAYLLPTDTDSDDFVDGKFMKLIRNSPHTMRLFENTDTDNKGLKVFKTFSIYFRGVMSKRKVKSFTADHLIKDEVDEANQENLKFADDRMLHSSHSLITELSQPSIDNFGIDAAFNDSNQMFWGIRCTKCRTWNFPDETFPDCIIKRGKTYYYGCVKCSRKLNNQKGQWVAKHPNRTKEHLGLHLSHLIFNLLTPEKIIKTYNKIQNVSDRKRFYISILGRPYLNPKARPITLSTIKEAERNYTTQNHSRKSFFGMDVGDLCHLVFGHIEGQTLKVHWFCEMQSDREKDIIELIRKHNPEIGIIDAMPYKTFAKNIARAFPDKVYIQYFKGDTIKSSIEGEDELAVPKITTNRTESIDTLADRIQNGRIVFPALKKLDGISLINYEILKTHCQNLIKDRIEKPDGSIVYQYKKNIPNHFGMALNSLSIAAFDINSESIEYSDRFKNGNSY